jgi:hypothetical protein
MVRRKKVVNTKRAKATRPHAKRASKHGVEDAAARLNNCWQELVDGGYEIDVGTTMVDLGVVDHRWERERVKRALPVPAGAHEPSLKCEFLDNPIERCVLSKEDDRLICCEVLEHRRAIVDR